MLLRSARVFVLKRLQYSAQCDDKKMYAEPSPALIQHLLRNHYVKVHGESHKDNDVVQYELNNLGKILSKNWEQEWWRFVRKCDKLTPIERDFSCTNESEPECEIVQQMSDEIRSHVNAAAAGNIEHNNKIGRVLVIMTRQSTKERDGDTLHEQLRFLKKFFSKASRLRITNGCGDSNSGPGIVYETDNAVLHIETTKKYGDSQVPDSSFHGVTLQLIDMKKLFWATMIDALELGRRPNILKLHPRLAPVKVVVQAEADIIDGNAEIIQELCDMVRSLNITCWNGMEKDIDEARADELGVPFIITLPNDLEKNGLLRLRSLSTSVEMIVHISQLSSTLMQYLSAT